MNGEDVPMPSDDELEETFGTLQAVLSSLPEPPRLEDDPAPKAVFDGARLVRDWANMDAELARLTHDSSLDSDLVSVRSGPLPRRIIFEGGSCEVEIEIEPSGRGLSMTGTVSPPTLGTVKAVVGGDSYQSAIDEFGTFVIDNVNPGMVMASLSTEDGTIRLAPFKL